MNEVFSTEETMCEVPNVELSLPMARKFELIPNALSIGLDRIGIFEMAKNGSKYQKIYVTHKLNATRTERQDKEVRALDNTEFFGYVDAA
jgi:hypothetical protein